VNLFGRTIRYEERAEEAIRKAKQKWSNIDDVLMAIEWAIMHDPQIGTLLNERGLRGFVFPGARSRDEPDVDVLYEETEFLLAIVDLVFREAQAHYAGQA
jgi:hypothetical protein